jgi:hypothetical protein
MVETKDSEMSQICIVSVKFLKGVRDFDRMQQIGNKKVIHRRTREIICNTFDYNYENNIPFYGVYEKFDTDNTFL